MPTPRKTTAKSAPAKKTPAKRAPRAVAQAQPKKASGIAAKRAQVRGEDGMHVDPYAPLVWGSDTAQGTLQDLELPSGQLCLAQRPGPEGLMAAGLLDDLDMLATVLPKVMGGKAAKKDLDATQVMRNPEMLRQAMRLMDRVVVHVVIKPELSPEPADPADRELGKIYPSSVSMEDKTFIFNWAVGGTRNLQSFRQQLEESVAGVESEQESQD